MKLEPCPDVLTFKGTPRNVSFEKSASMFKSFTFGSNCIDINNKNNFPAFYKFKDPIQSPFKKVNKLDLFVQEEDRGSETYRPMSPATARSRKSYLSKIDIKDLKKDLNNFCNECHVQDPEWVSVNNGIFICLQCSAFHRGYGVQISFVRSLELDQLDPI